MKRLLFTAAALGAVVGCTSSSNTGSGGSGTTAAAVAGKADTHCSGMPAVVVDPSVCHAVANADAGDDGGAGGGGGDVGETNFNAEADDDDCKYHVKWTATTVAEKTDVTFFVTLTNKKDGSPVTGAPVRAEVFLNDTHPAPNTNQTSSETSSGVYGVGPIQFDASGKWTVRFHFHEECNDSPASPHGHAAFFVQVP